MPILGGQSKTVGESTHIGALTLVFMGFLLSCNRNMNMYLGRFSSVNLHQGPVCWWRATLVIDHLFAVALSWWCSQERLPIMPGPEIHHKMTEVNGFLIQQALLAISRNIFHSGAINHILIL